MYKRQLVEHEGKYYESLSLAMVRVLLGNPQVVPGYPEGEASSGPEWLDLPAEQGILRIPVDEYGASLIPYRGLQGSFTYLSAADALTGRLKQEQLKGKIVLLGTTAPCLMDLREMCIRDSLGGIPGNVGASTRRIAPMCRATSTPPPKWAASSRIRGR